MLHGGPQMLPPEWRDRAGEPGGARAAMVVCDYIAGMTDQFLLEQHRQKVAAAV
jgi:dGTPase